MQTWFNCRQTPAESFSVQIENLLFANSVEAGSAQNASYTESALAHAPTVWRAR
jgi:hypothetical protein